MESNRYPSLRMRLALVLIALATLFAAGVSSVLYVNFRRELRNNLHDRLENITTLAGFQQNGDALIRVQASQDEFFRLIHEQNRKIKASDPDLRFVYTMRKDARGIYFVVDARISPAEPDISEFGDIYEEPSATLVANFDTMTGTIIEPDFYTDEFGTFLSGYAPIFTTSGERAGVLGVDISAATIRTQENEFLSRLIIIFLSTLPFIVAAGFIIAKYLAKPIIALRDVADKTSHGDFTHRITKIPRTRELADLALNFNKMIINLSELINNLEQRVAERTADIKQKTDQLRSASYITRQSAEMQDLDTLLNTVTKLISEQFGFYHVGIFLVNQPGTNLILQASSSEGGRQMIANGYILGVGPGSMIGQVAAQKNPRIALDVGTDAVSFSNPDLPATRSEVALSLTIRNKTLGVLDIQSDIPRAFSMEDVDVLQTIADQIAVAIENARLWDEAQAAVQQLEAVTAIRTREAWEQKLQRGSRTFTYTPLGMRAEKSSQKDEKALSASITLRGQKIGNIWVSRKGNTDWSMLDEELIAEVAKQTGLAVDNIRLLEEATQRAAHEQIISKLATRFSQSFDTDALLRTAAHELGALPDVSEVTVFLNEQVSGFSSRPQKTGYRFDNTRLQQISEIPEPVAGSHRDEAAISSEDIERESINHNQIVIPIKMRGQKVGVVNAVFKPGYDRSLIFTMESAVERLASALESARLYEDSRIRADRETSISRVTSAIGSSTEYEEILQTTVREVGAALKDTEVAIRILDDPFEQPTDEIRNQYAKHI